MKAQLNAAISLHQTELDNFNQEYTKYLGQRIYNFIQKQQILNLDAVCSHGHTVFHQPENGLTLQIGNIPKIADYIQQTVVCDFRVQDVMAVREHLWFQLVMRFYFLNMIFV